MPGGICSSGGEGPIPCGNLGGAMAVRCDGGIVLVSILWSIFFPFVGNAFVWPFLLGVSHKWRDWYQLLNVVLLVVITFVSDTFSRLLVSYFVFVFFRLW